MTNRLGGEAEPGRDLRLAQARRKPIQPLTIVHRDTYVDYSHGVRLIRRTVMVDGKPRDIRHALHAADVCGLLE